jgi:hypothetical protein
LKTDSYGNWDVQCELNLITHMYGIMAIFCEHRIEISDSIK